jgi:ATP-dependent protease HslVU (ClpYQ) peptidase subunit
VDRARDEEMTTIAYKDGIVAVDSQSTCGDIISSLNETKIRKTDKGVFILSGVEGDCHLFSLIWPHGNSVTGGECCGFVFDCGVLYRAGFDEEGKIERQRQDLSQTWAFGSGMPFALAAMDMGASAVDAVKLAIKRDPFSGGKVKIFKLPVKS